ncbi:MAG: hypothetical protein OIN85_01130 [Candidatus Methanoperedens sp.]|nr:hypothetical protein [Candidatus Methanoperedens sp.]
MSPYTTMCITREDAEFELSKRGLTIPRPNDEVESKLFAIFGDSCLYNFSIVYEYEESDDGWWPCNYYRGRFDTVPTPDDVLRDEPETAKAYQFCPHCGEKL